MSVRDQLEAIREKHGYLDPQLVVDEARPKAHPLHDRLDWNDKSAGEAYRREQAHALIRSVRVAYVANDRPMSARAYLAVPRPEHKQPTYEPTEEVMRDEFTRTLVLSQMEREWRAMQARYGDLIEFGDMIRGSVSA